MKYMLAVLLFGVLTLLTYVTFEYVRVRSLVFKSRTLVAQTHPYQHSLGRVSVLVIGDSTAVGVGAASSSESIAGLLGSSLHASVENHGVSGAVTAQMEGQLHAAQQSHYDLVLIQVGANDIVGVGSLDAVNAHMKTLLDDVQRYSDHIVLMTAGRVGDAPLLPILARPFLNWRTAKLRTLFMENAIAHAVAYVDLYTNPSDVFASDTSHYYAIDMFHPSAAGYAVWFAVLEQTIRQSWRGALYGDQ